MNANLATEVPSVEHEFFAVQGESYQQVLARLHEYLKPSTYLEVGTLEGETLKLAKCKSIAVDPIFRIGTDVIGTKPSCMFFQCRSDSFFREYSPSAIFHSPVDLAFLDGLHLFEFLLRDFLNVERHCARNSIVALHDCVPADRWMAERIYTDECRKQSQRPGWWTGDVWKCLPALKKYRPDLQIIVVDARLTGLVLITNLDPKNSVLADNYANIVREFIGLNIAEYGIQKYQNDCAMIPTRALARFEDVSKFFWL